MEEELEEELNKKYKIKIEVRFKDFREYEVTIKELEIKFDFLYNVRSTLQGNVNDIVNIIDKKILKEFRKE